MQKLDQAHGRNRSGSGLKDVRAIQAGLKKNEWLVCRLHLLDGHSQTQVAAWMKIDPRSVRRLLCRAIVKVPRLAEFKPGKVSRVRPVALPESI